MSEFPATTDVRSLEGANEFRLAGVAVDANSGRSASSAGDVNDARFDNVIAGAWGAAGDTGASHVVPGKPGFFAPNLDPSSFDGTNVFRLADVANDDRNGRSVSSAGAAPSDRYAATSPTQIGPARSGQAICVSRASPSCVVEERPTEPAARIEPASSDETCEHVRPRNDERYKFASRAWAWKRRLNSRSFNRRYRMSNLR